MMSWEELNLGTVNILREFQPRVDQGRVTIVKEAEK